MKYLVDTCVFSEFQRPIPHTGVVKFVEQWKPELWISVLTIGELVRGAHAMSPGKRRNDLKRWINHTESEYALRLIPIDLETVRVWGEVSGELRRRGVQVAPVDGLIAATALQHGIHVVTRNVKDFEPTGVSIVNPWEGSSSS